MTQRELAARLDAVGVEESDCEARIIFRELSGKSSAELMLGKAELDGSVLEPIIKRRSEKEPLAYILGVCYFYNETYKVTPDVLIPRQDTELLVSTAAREMKEGENILDLCTGSGCVGISMLTATENTTALLVDISERALAVAKENAELNHVRRRTEFMCLDVLSDLPSGEFYAILSNPPYVSESAYRALAPEIYKEPKQAFVGGTDGLDFYRSLIPRLGKILKSGGFIAFEIGYDQARSVCEIASEFGYESSVYKDFCQQNRVVILRWEGENA